MNRQIHKRKNKYKLFAKGYNINGDYWDGKEMRFYLDFRPLAYLKKFTMEQIKEFIIKKNFGEDPYRL